MSRSIIARIATSADGFIARKDGSVDFLNERPRPKGSYGMGEFIIHIVPTLIGEGIPPLAPRHRRVPLKLTGVQKFPDGVVHLDYTVSRAS
jgi:hypothetical protein